MFPLIVIPTRVTPSTNSCIDNIVTNFEAKSCKVESYDVGLSDHRAQFVTKQNK